MSEPLHLLAELVRRETGNDLPEGRLPLLREAADRRCRALGGLELGRYVEALGAGTLPGEWDLLVSLLTIKESSFYRVPQQWDRLRAELLPELVRRRAPERRLRFWSAACAAGEEPGTLALLLAELPGLSGWDWSILATDLDADALAQAERGLYGERAVAAVPRPQREAWLIRHGRLFELDRRLRARIVYRRLNLARPPYRLTEERFDVVLLRNVLIYFRPELQRAVVAEVTRRLAPDGWLLLGGSETLWRIQDQLRPVDLGDCFAYRHPEAPTERGHGIPTAEHGPDRTPVAEPEPPPAVPPEPPAPTPAERILNAVTHLEADRIADAEREARAALDEDPADPAVHALLGLLHELGGSDETAADAFRAALYLEPELAQVRLLLAGCLRRTGSAELAARHYRQVITTLERGGGRRLAALDGRLVPAPAEALRRAREALTSIREG